METPASSVRLGPTPPAAPRIPHLITTLTAGLPPKKSRRKEISLKKCVCLREAGPSPRPGRAKAVVLYC